MVVAWRLVPQRDMFPTCGIPAYAGRRYVFHRSRSDKRTALIVLVTNISTFPCHCQIVVVSFDHFAFVLYASIPITYEFWIVTFPIPIRTSDL